MDAPRFLENHVSAQLRLHGHCSRATSPFRHSASARSCRRPAFGRPATGLPSPIYFVPRSTGTGKSRHRKVDQQTTNCTFFAPRAYHQHHTSRHHNLWLPAKHRLLSTVAAFLLLPGLFSPPRDVSKVTVSPKLIGMYRACGCKWCVRKRWKCEWKLTEATPTRN